MMQNFRKMTEIKNKRNAEKKVFEQELAISEKIREELK